MQKAKVTGSVTPVRALLTYLHHVATAGEAGRPTSDRPEGAGNADQGSGAYTLLGAAHAGLAAACFLAPNALINLFFPGGLAGRPDSTRLRVRGCGRPGRMEGVMSGPCSRCCRRGTAPGL
jgi:hypothetical protein